MADTSISSGTNSNQTQQQSVQSGVSSTNSGNQNTYAPGAAGLQGGGANALQQILAGGSPSPNYGLTQGAYDQAQRQFNSTIAPQLATQYGAGSPTIGNALIQQNEDLAAQSSQMAWGNMQGTMADVEKFAFTPTGNQTEAQQAQSQAQSQTGAEQGAYQGNSLSITDLLSGLGGLFAGFSKSST